jgi:hypothetical protein
MDLLFNHVLPEKKPSDAYLNSLAISEDLLPKIKFSIAVHQKFIEICKDRSATANSKQAFANLDRLWCHSQIIRLQTISA